MNKMAPRCVVAWTLDSTHVITDHKNPTQMKCDQLQSTAKFAPQSLKQTQTRGQQQMFAFRLHDLSWTNGMDALSLRSMRRALAFDPSAQSGSPSPVVVAVTQIVGPSIIINYKRSRFQGDRLFLCPIRMQKVGTSLRGRVIRV